MKFPLRLPVCPHCGGKFSYRQVNKTKKQKEQVCPHCKTMYACSYDTGGSVLIAISVAVIAAVVCILLSVIPDIHIGILFVIIFGILISMILLFPLTVRYQVIPPKEAQSQSDVNKKRRKHR